MTRYIVLCNYNEKYWYRLSPLYVDKKLTVSTASRKHWFLEEETFKSKNKAKSFIKYARKSAWLGSYRRQNINSYKYFKIIPVEQESKYFYHLKLDTLEKYHLVSNNELKEIEKAYTELKEYSKKIFFNRKKEKNK